MKLLTVIGSIGSTNWAWCYRHQRQHMHRILKNLLQISWEKNGRQLVWGTPGHPDKEEIEW